MTLVNVKFRNTEVSLESDDPAKLVELAERLNKRAEEICGIATHVTDAKLAIISALMLEDQNEALRKKVESERAGKSSNLDEAKAAFSETLNQICDYVEHLASRLEKR